MTLILEFSETNGDLLGILILPFACLFSLTGSMFIRRYLLASSEVYTISVDHVIHVQTMPIDMSFIP